MQELLSHPDRSLENHLGEVKHWGMFYKNMLQCEVLSNIDDEIVISFFIFHDMGKSTSFFQQYIRKEKVKENLKSHAGISAMIFLYYHIVKETINLSEDLIVEMTYVILKHHGDLIKFSDIDNYMGTEHTELLKIQYKAIDYSNLIHKILKLGLDSKVLEQVLNGDADLFINNVSEFFRSRRNRLSRERIRKKKNDKIDQDLINYFTMQILYSLLIDADKSQVILGNTELAHRVNFKTDVEDYIKRKSVKKTFLNSMRSRAFKEVNDNVNVDGNIFTLTLPTGMGKTLNSLNYALQLREQLYEKEKILYRIIYVIPYMSIIDQNAKVIEDVLKQKNKVVTNAMLCKHHHLTEITWITDENTLLDNDNAQILLEGWNSEIIITTFEQFFLTLAGYKNSMQRKYTKLCNAIVIVDEIQTIPVKYYKFVGKLLTDYTRYMNSKVIAMTATQPHIFEEDISQSLCDYKKYYHELSRTIIINELNYSKTIDEFIEEIECQTNKRYLFILNTIESAKKMYLLLKDNFLDYSITYLSTMLPPKERLKRIEQIKNKEFDIVVSTQLVEAGVDIDFDVVYRDFAPLPSIFQSSGRANREGRLDKIGEVHLIKLKDKKGFYADKVYRNAKTDLDVTEQILKEHDQLKEHEFMEVIEKYFDKMSDEDVKSQHVSDALINGAASQWFYGDKELCNQINSTIPLNSFELIEDTGDKFSVFIELDEEAEKLWNDYLTISQEVVEKWQHRRNMKAISRKLSEYIVDIRIATKNKYNKPPLDENEVYYYVGNSDIDKYYCYETGFGIESNVY